MYLFNVGEVALSSLGSPQFNTEVLEISIGFIPGKDSRLPPDRSIIKGLISRTYGILFI